MQYNNLLREAAGHVDIYEHPLQPRNKGFYNDGIIWINKHIPHIEKACILAEELGHYHTSVGDITDQSVLENRKQELRARQWAYYKLIPLERIIAAHHARVMGRHELADFLEVTEEFLEAAIHRYQEKYGICVAYDRYIIYFDPLGVAELFV